MDNITLANQLREMARKREREQACLYRARAYRKAAMVVLGLNRPVVNIVAREGRHGLRAIPGIGARIAETIESLVRAEAVATLTEEPLLAAV